VRAWLAVNLFLLVLVALGAGLFWALGSLARPLGPWGIGIAGVVAIALTGFIMARLHRLLERWVNRRAR
jgi:hypothetical protein